MKTIRKVLCVILSVMLAASSCAVLAFNSAALEDDSAFDFDLKGLSSFIVLDDVSALNVPDFDDIETSIKNGELKNVQMGPMTLEQIYDTGSPSNWENIKNKGDVSASTLFVTMGNLNTFFKNLINRYYTKELIYSSETATWLTNKIVDIFFGTKHDKITVTLAEDEIGDQAKFIKAVLRNAKMGISNFVDFFQTSVINKEVNVLPLCYALGVNLDNIWKKDKAQEVLEETLKSVIMKFLEDPLYYPMDVIWAVCRTYNSTMCYIFKKMLSMRIANGEITEKEFDQPHELLNLIFNGNDASVTDKLQFFAAPYVKIGRANDRIEMFYYLFVYALLVGTYKNNENVIKEAEKDVMAYNYVDITNADKGSLCDILEGLATSDPSKIIGYTANSVVDNVKTGTTNVLQLIVNRIKEILVNLLAKLDKFFSFPLFNF